MFTFLAPIWLLAIPLTAGLLIFAYLRNGKSFQNKISSLFFIKQVAPSLARGRRKLSLPLRLLFELLVLFSLIASISGMFLNNSSERAILIIDNSPSMGALLNPGESKVTILEEAKRSAKSNLELFSEIKLASVWATSPEPHQITAGFVSSSQASDKIEELSIGFGTGNVSSLLSRLNDTAPKILIFTDQIAAPQQFANNPTIKLVPLTLQNPQRENLAIENISIDSSIDKSSSQVIVKVRAYLNNQALCRISIAKFDSDSWKPIASKDVGFSGIEAKEITFNLNSLYQEGLSSPLKAQIGSCSPEGSNSLNLDDMAWITPTQENSAIILVSDFSAQQLGLDRISGIKIDPVKPQDWSARKAKNQTHSKKDEMIIFHRFVPKELPNSNALFISPPEGSALFPVKKFNNSTRLVRWENESLLLRYLTLPNIELKEVVRFTDLPPWSNALMYSPTGPVAIYGNLTQNRYVALGFELFPFEGGKNPFFSILTLNLFKWLSNVPEDQGSSNLLKINLNSKIKSATLVDSLLPHSLVEIAPNKESVAIQSPGLIKITAQDSPEFIAANFFSLNESNVKEAGFVNLPKEPSTKEGLKSSGMPLEVYLILIALSVLLLDSLIFVYKKPPSKRRSNAL